MTAPDTSDAVARVRAAIGDGHAVRRFDASTRTAAEAAAAIGCTVAQIAKSIVFRARDSGRPVLVVLSGVDRASEAKVAALLGERVARADAEFVRSRTGYAIGGVPPVAHREPPVAFVDVGLRAFDTIWAAAGTPNAVFETRFDALVAMAGARVADVAERAPRD
jgi:prolyl-tRNA editing enzyme YbaK/EbsC (Cys-tRNA(Pro) deacylase)